MNSPWPQRFVVLALSLLAAILLSPALGEMGGDSAQYLSLADSLLQGSYRDLHLPGAPWHSHYPPGLALLLAPVTAVFGTESLLPHKLVLLGFAAWALQLGYRFARLRVPQLHALLVLLLVGSGGAWVMQSVRVQSEMPFACMLLLFVLEAERERPRRARLLLWAALAFALRSVGVVPLLLAPFVGVQRADERVDGLPGDRRSISGRAAGMRWRPHVPSLVLSLGLLGAWLLYGQLAASGTWGYGEEFVARSGGFAQLPGYLLEGLLFQLRSFALLIVDHPLADRHVWAALVLASPILLGMLRHLRERRPAEWVFVLSWGLILLAPARTSRYFVPMLPLLAVYFVDGLRVLAALLRRWRPMPKLRHVPSFAVALLLIVHLLALAPILERRHRALVIDAPPLQRQALGELHLEQWEEGWLLPQDAAGQRYAMAYGSFLLALRAARQQLPAEAVLAHRKPRLVAWLSGRRCVPMPDRMDPEELRVALRKLGVTHILDGGLFVSMRRILGASRQALGLELELQVRGAQLWRWPAPALRAAPR
jgi:hypothetical protein